MWQPPSLINSLQTGVYQPPQLIKPLQKGISTPTHVFGVNRGIASMRQFQSAGISDITAIERDVNTRRTLRLQDIREKVELKRYGDLNIHLKDPEAGYGIAIMATREGVKHYLDTGENPAPHYRAIEEENIEPAVATPEQEEIIAITEV